MPAFSRRRFLPARWAINAILILTYMLVFFRRMAPAETMALAPRVSASTPAGIRLRAEASFDACFRSGAFHGAAMSC
jgi:hypothetical protein